MTIWMDLTNSLMSYKGNVVGIIRAELMLAKEIHKIDSQVRFSICTKYGFKEISPDKLDWLWQADDLNDAYRKFQNKKKTFIGKVSQYVTRKIDSRLFRFYRTKRNKSVSKKSFIIYPYKNGDVVFSCGWYGTKKEEYFSRVCALLPSLKLVYTIYDLCMVKPQLRYLYYPHDIYFDQYLLWIVNNCDYIIYGGHTAQSDAREYFGKAKLNAPESGYVKWGCDINRKKKNVSAEPKQVFDKFNISVPYVLAIGSFDYKKLAVGSFDYKKNYEVLYQAYCMLNLAKKENVPQLVIVGRFIKDVEQNLQNAFQQNPLVEKCVKIVSCSDEELDVLYKNCLFTVLPTLYEGWSLTLPESLSYGKLCLCSDVAPLREAAGDLAVYVDPKHPKEWAENIIKYSKNKNLLAERENLIRKNWKPVLWKDSAQSLYKKLVKIAKTNNSHLYYELGLFHMQGGLSGIPRTQLILARQLYKINKNITFFFMSKGRYYEYSHKQLKHLLGQERIDLALSLDQQAYRISLPEDIPFKKGDVVLSVGIGYDKKSYEALAAKHKAAGFKYIQLIYDFTPITVPHTHPQERVKAYPDFLNKMYTLSDFVLYGGKTAQKDGLEYQKKNGFDVKPSAAVKFGSDLVSLKTTKERKEKVFEKYGITGEFLLTVGTIEARKNHALLYEAYIELMRDEKFSDKLPQLVICGHPGWRTEHFRHVLSVDTRIFNKVIMISPSDDELDVLYQTCKFTLLASLYEGWSLTLPESLNYGKFCLAADTPSLTEIGEDIIDYANPYDPYDWAEKIRYYVTTPKALSQKERAIKQKWVNTTWQQCGENINHIIYDFLQKEKSND